VFIVTRFVLRSFLELYSLLCSDCLVSMTTTVILSTETFIKFLGNIVNRFNCHGTNNLVSTKGHIFY
jgi:creatinine amidohydrolase/Fe(II)-dependent formamide hydrolase-like protein